MLGSNSSVGWGPKLHGGAIEPRLPFLMVRMFPFEYVLISVQLWTFKR